MYIFLNHFFQGYISHTALIMVQFYSSSLYDNLTIRNGVIFVSNTGLIFFT